MTLYRQFRSRIAGLFLTLFVWMLLPLPVLAEDSHPREIEGVPTNLGLADTMARLVADEVVADLEDWLGKSVALRAGKESSGNPLVLIV